MSTVRVNLIPYQKSWELPRDQLRQVFPESLLAQALEGDPEAEEINIENNLVIPTAMNILAGLLRGEEPQGQVLEDLEPSADYLNIPSLPIYNDYYYGELDHPVTDSPQNRKVLVDVASVGDIPMIQYLLERGVNPMTEGDSPALRETFKTDDVETFQALWPAVEEEMDANELVHSAIQSDALQIFQFFLETVASQPRALFQEAVEAGAEKIATYLAETYLDNEEIKNEIYHYLNEEDLGNNVDLPIHILQSVRRINYADDPILENMIMWNHTRLARQLLADPGYAPYLSHYREIAEEVGNLRKIFH